MKNYFVLPKEATLQKVLKIFNNNRKPIFIRKRLLSLHQTINLRLFRIIISLHKSITSVHLLYENLYKFFV
jgi:hypothetical protein